MFSSEETERYARHIVLAGVGGPGQQKLKAARVLVVGAGGLGSPVLQYLAAAGVGTIGIVDDDTVALSNLQRQPIHGVADLGRPKVLSASEAIGRLNPHVDVHVDPVRLDAGNAAATVAGWDVVVDAVDNFPTRFAVADACAAARIPLVTAGVQEFWGWLTVLAPWLRAPDGTPRPGLRSMMREPEEGRTPTCALVGILGVVPGVLGTLAATEVLKLLLGLGEPLIGRLLEVDLLDGSFDVEEILGESDEGAAP